MKQLIVLFFIFIHGLTIKLMAQTLLVPAKNVDHSVYTEQCHKSGYLCTDDFILEKLKNRSTPQFNALLDNLDLMNDLDRKKLPDDIQMILKTEMISIEQLNSLIQICEKSLFLETNKKTEFLKKEMLEVIKNSDNVSDTTKEKITYLFFKQKVSEKQFLKMKSKWLNYIYYKIDVFSISDQKENRIDFLIGDCTNHRLASILADESQSLLTLPMFQKECTFSAEIQKSVTKASNFVVEYQKPLIWTAVAAGALFFLKNYSVEFK
jgi:hypothetical protein